MSFSPLPAVPQAGVPDWQFQFLNAVKQNVEQITGQFRGAEAYTAVLKGELSAAYPSEMQTVSVTFSGTGYTIATVGNVPKYEDFVSLLSTVQGLIYDVQALRATVVTLMQQLKR